jgi:HAD superfamily hydrolase (TIGR01509 family)
MYAAALFDLDGLLIDSERVIMSAWLRVATEQRVQLTAEAYQSTIGLTAVESAAVLVGAFGSKERLASAQARVDALLQDHSPGDRYPLKPGVLRLLDALERRGVPCAAVSSTARGEVNARLADAGIRGYFAAVAAGDEVRAGKPDPAVYLLAAARLDVATDRCIAFEDSRNGAQAALSARADLVLVPDLVAPSAELAARCVCVLTSLEETVPRIDEWFGPPPEGTGQRDRCG